MGEAPAHLGFVGREGRVWALSINRVHRRKREAPKAAVAGEWTRGTSCRENQDCSGVVLLVAQLGLMAESQGA